jgi:hypothetical protein
MKKIFNSKKVGKTLYTAFMAVDTALYRNFRASDLSFSAGRRRQSPRTGYVHFFRGDEAASDTIPLYENFCFALSLFEQKKADCALEAKDLLARLFAFQTLEGNFPLYLHDFPRCYDGCQGLKIGPILIRILKEFGPILSEEEKKSLRSGLERIVQFAQKRPLEPMWALRLSALVYELWQTPFSVPTLDFSFLSQAELWEYAVTLQWACPLFLPFFHAGLNRFMGPSYGETAQGLQLASSLLDWAAAPDKNAQDASLQLQLPALKQVHLTDQTPPLEWDVKETPESSLWLWKGGEIPSTLTSLLRMVWKEKEKVHSLVLPPSSFTWRAEIQDHRVEMLIYLPPLQEMGREDLFEVAFFVDASPEIALFIEGQKGTLFHLQDRVSIETASQKITLRFEQIEGEAQFCGHLFRSNRPGQLSLSGPLKYEAYDWKIGLRTLRRSAPCTLRIEMEVSNAPGSF